MAHQVLFKPSARKALLKLPEPVRSRLLRRIEALGIEPRPHGVEKLAGDDNLWRIRDGTYRVVYEIHDEQLVVLVLRVAHRRDVYR